MNLLQLGSIWLKKYMFMCIYLYVHANKLQCSSQSIMRHSYKHLIGYIYTYIYSVLIFVKVRKQPENSDYICIETRIR